MSIRMYKADVMIDRGKMKGNTLLAKTMKKQNKNWKNY